MYYGMEPASPDRLSFRASVFASAPDVSELPPSIRFPRRAGGEHLVRAGGNRHITEAHLWMGRPFYPVALRAAGSMQVLASEYRHRRGHEMRIPERCVKEVGAPGMLPWATFVTYRNNRQKIASY